MAKFVKYAVPLIAAMTIPQPAAAQQAFEGSVTYSMKMQRGQEMQMVHHVRGSDIRIDMNINDQAVSIISDMMGSKQLMLMHRQKQWMDMKAMQERMAGMMPPGVSMPGSRGEPREAKPPEELNMRATGQKETIAGHECEHFIFSADGSEVDMCAAKGLGWYFGSPMGGGMMGMGGRGNRGAGAPEMSGLPGVSNAQLEQWQKLYADGFFPLKIEVRGGATPVTLIVTDITKRRPEEALYRAPADFKEMRIGG